MCCAVFSLSRCGINTLKLTALKPYGSNTTPPKHHMTRKTYEKDHSRESRHPKQTQSRIVRHETHVTQTHLTRNQCCGQFQARQLTTKKFTGRRTHNTCKHMTQTPHHMKHRAHNTRHIDSTSQVYHATRKLISKRHH